MKTRFVRTFAFLTLLGTSAGAYATDNPIPAGTDACGSIAALAEITMNNRQMGVPLGIHLDAIAGQEAEGNALAPVLRMMALAAWEEPRYSSPGIVARVTGEFRDRWHLRCLRAQ